MLCSYLQGKQFPSFLNKTSFTCTFPFQNWSLYCVVGIGFYLAPCNWQVLMQLSTVKEVGTIMFCSCQQKLKVSSLQQRGCAFLQFWKTLHFDKDLRFTCMHCSLLSFSCGISFSIPLACVAVFSLSSVVSHSQSFLFDSLACFAVFSLPSVVSHSQSLLSYRQVFCFICLPCHFLLRFSRLFLSLTVCFSNLCSAVSKVRLTYLSLLFCGIFSLQLTMVVIRKLQNLAYPRFVKSPRRPNLSRIRKIFRALPGCARTT